ncbi:hypothetical protein LOTGIDRAFT_217677 [Lottia gigantea]|uniref:M-phase phosphoprotein 6 n=1 Tax=Lottia gigantea TaxID=225164 RepID=V4BPB6_LOTGI|nr:hypothetical protein LOTGIDRAFT_217677 [Lottia gigantea]ESO90819.1 hypothetical protein LOTGIDRAFT_217677 [Lottia gigantea]
MGDKKDSSGLSKNLMQMKFMQRSVLRIEEEKNAEEKQRDIDDEHWVLDIPRNKQKESRYHIESSYVICENLNYGRMSFKGCNPEIEKLMKSNNAEKEYKVSRQIEKETEVNDQDMAKRYSTLIGIIAKKFAKKRENNSAATGEDGIKKAKTPKIFPDPDKPQILNKVKKFLKPVDEDS